MTALGYHIKVQRTRDRATFFSVNSVGRYWIENNIQSVTDEFFSVQAEFADELIQKMEDDGLIVWEIR